MKNLTPQPLDTAEQPRPRRGVVLVLTAILLVTIFGFVAFSVDYGYMSMVTGNLQNAADSAALASVVELGSGESAAVGVAGELAAANRVGANSPSLDMTRTEAGIFDPVSKVFTPTSVGPNAMRVRTELKNVPLFFAPVLGKKKFSASAEAIAMTKPREIVLVVDLSSSMNNDTQPTRSPWRIRDGASSRGLSNADVGFDLMDDLWDDFGFGAYPGDSEHIGEGLVPSNTWAYGNMTWDFGPLATETGPVPYYKHHRNAPEWKRKRAAYRWIIDNQIARLMPDAKPAPDSTNNASWQHYKRYLDWVISRKTWNKAYGGRKGSWSGTVDLPTDVHWRKLGNYSNPDTGDKYRDRVGYETYVEWLTDCGRDRRPTNDYHVSSGTLTQMSLDAPPALRTTHEEAVNGDTFDMPPRLYPMHACRRSLIRAVQKVREKNSGVSAGVADRVAVVSFDATSEGRWPKVVVPLTTDYDAAMLACSKLQVIGSGNSGGSTSAQIGLDLAAEQLIEHQAGGPARNGSEKVMIFLCDGSPNLRDMSDADVNQYVADNPSPDYYQSSDFPWSSYPDYYAATYNAPLIAAHKARQKSNALLFSVGMGVGVNYGFMDRLSRISGTDKGGQSERTSGDPLEYEESIAAILENIIQYAGVSLVK